MRCHVQTAGSATSAARHARAPTCRCRAASRFRSSPCRGSRSCSTDDDDDHDHGDGVSDPISDAAGTACWCGTGTPLQFDAGRSTVMRLSGAGIRLQDLTALLRDRRRSDHHRFPGSGAHPLDHGWRRCIKPHSRCVAPRGRPSTSRDGCSTPGWMTSPVRNGAPGRSDRPTIDLVRSGTLRHRPRSRHGAVRVLTVRSVMSRPSGRRISHGVETPDGAIVITGDTLVCDEVATLAHGANVLVYEAMRFTPSTACGASAVRARSPTPDTRLMGPGPAGAGRADAGVDASDTAARLRTRAPVYTADVRVVASRRR